MRGVRYRGSVLAVVACIVVATAAFASVIPLLDFQGFDWFWPAEIGQPGSCYSAVGYVPQVDSSFRVYCDPIASGTAADYGMNPPNGSSPSTFEDGDCVLHGDWVSDLEIFLDLGTGAGDISGMLDFTGGSQLANIPPTQREQAFALAGITFDPPGPEGYHWQIDGNICIQEPVNLQPSSWSNIKRSRGGN